MEPLVLCVKTHGSHARDCRDKKSLGRPESREGAATVVTRRHEGVKGNLPEKSPGGAPFAGRQTVGWILPFRSACFTKSKRRQAQSRRARAPSAHVRSVVRVVGI